MTPKEIKAKIDLLKEERKLYKKMEQEYKEKALGVYLKIKELTKQCPHKHVRKIHSSSGAYHTQIINCLDCEQEVISGQHLFHPRDADEVHSIGN